MSIAALLLLSGMISFYELNSLSRNAEGLAVAHDLHVGQMQRMLDATESQRRAVEALQPDSLWMAESYLPEYERVKSTIADYLASDESSVSPRIERLHRHAYSSVTPVLISLLVMVAAVLLLWYFTAFYCVRPIVSMNRSLGQYLAFKTPFSAKSELKDELEELRDKIENLITIAKK